VLVLVLALALALVLVLVLVLVLEGWSTTEEHWVLVRRPLLLRRTPPEATWPQTNQPTQ
jgi:hypothetical protein